MMNNFHEELKKKCQLLVLLPQGTNKKSFEFHVAEIRLRKEQATGITAFSLVDNISLVLLIVL